jgi:hypothetical protein
MKYAALWVLVTLLAFVEADHLLSTMGHSGFIAGFVQSMIK